MPLLLPSQLRRWQMLVLRSIVIGTPGRYAQKMGVRPAEGASLSCDACGSRWEIDQPRRADHCERRLLNARKETTSLLGQCQKEPTG